MSSDVERLAAALQELSHAFRSPLAIIDATLKDLHAERPLSEQELHDASEAVRQLNSICHTVAKCVPVATANYEIHDIAEVLSAHSEIPSCNVHIDRKRFIAVTTALTGILAPTDAPLESELDSSAEEYCVLTLHRSSVTDVSWEALTLPHNPNALIIHWANAILSEDGVRFRQHVSEGELRAVQLEIPRSER